MIKKIIIALLIGLFFAVSSAKSQSYKIDTFEGNTANIKLYYKPASGMFSISYLKDTLLINDYMTVDSVNILNRVFLQITYVKRAGSNEDTINQLILYVSNGKLCQALHINSLTTYDMRPSEYSLFKLKATLEGHDTKTYKLRLNIHNEKRSSRSPKTNFKYDKVEALTFDINNKVFYSRFESLSGYYTFHNVNDDQLKKKYIKSGTPVVIVEKDKYYYINGNWYTKDKRDFYSMML